MKRQSPPDPAASRRLVWQRLGRLRAGALALTCALAGSLSLTTFEADAQIRRSDDAQYTNAGFEGCLRCHGDTRMHAITDTVHGNADNPFTPAANQGCESCHGPGSLHVSRARGGIGFPAMISFRDASIEQQTQACLGCHAQDMGDRDGFQWVGSVHDNGIVSCVSCHQVHMPNERLGERTAQVQICSACHAGQIASHRRFENVGIVFEDLSCYNCHEVHEMIRER